MSSTFTAEQQNRIRKFLETDNPAHLAGEDADTFGHKGSSKSGVVSVQECDEWRSRARRGESAADIHGIDTFCNPTIRDHIYGRCSHPEHAVGEPAESPGPGPGGHHG